MNDSANAIALEDYGMLVGRLLMASVFALGAIHWIFVRGHGPVSMLENAGWPMPVLLSWLALVAKTAGSLSIVLGFKTRYGALVLIAFILVASLGFHLPASIMPPDSTVFKEIGLVGAFLILAIVGPGRLSLDSKLDSKKAAYGISGQPRAK